MFIQYKKFVHVTFSVHVFFFIIKSCDFITIVSSTFSEKGLHLQVSGDSYQ